jgi:acyl carrier protein
LTRDEIKRDARAFVAAQFLPGESPDSIGDDTKLFSEGILDSLASLKLVSWLEEKYGVQIEAHEVGVDHLDTLELIADLVLAKRG